MEQYKQKFDKICSDIDARIKDYPSVKMLTDKVFLRPSYLVLSAGVAFALFIFFGFGAVALINLIGFLYPLYMSFKTLKDREAHDEQVTQWLTYWVVYAFFIVSESFTDIMFRWIPLYLVVKLAFLVWCQMEGASLVYHKFLEPIIARLEYVPPEQKKSM